MKKFLVIAITGIVVFGSCKKPAITYMSTAKIMGLEPFMTPCDAKYWIVINDSTAGRTFDSLPPDSGINPALASSASPINVKVNWHNTGRCGIVVIDAVEKTD